MMKIIMALTLVGAIVASTFAFAAATTPIADQIGAGDALVTACAATADVHWVTDYDGTQPIGTGGVPGAFITKGVNVNAAPACAGQRFRLWVTFSQAGAPSGAGQSWIDTTLDQNGDIVYSAANLGSHLTLPVRAQDIGDVHILINTIPVP